MKRGAGITASDKWVNYTPPELMSRGSKYLHSCCQGGGLLSSKQLDKYVQGSCIDFYDICISDSLKRLETINRLSSFVLLLNKNVNARPKGV